MRISNITTALLSIGLFIGGCTRDNDVIEDPAAPVGGKGGRAMLRVTPRHHMKNIDSCTIYIEYNSTKHPAEFSFDDSMKVSQIDNRPIAEFKDLKDGDYYLYARGWDPEVSTDTIGHVVLGAAPFTILDSTKTYDVYIDVNESADHYHPKK